MTREEIISAYEIDDNGIIRSPGKFEGEMLYVPYFWDAGLNGCADFEQGEVWGFRITPEDREQFPELPKKRRTIKLLESEYGFVSEV